MTDAALIWRWANDRETRANSFNTSPIPWDEHVAWLERRLGSDATRTWIFCDGDTPVGQVRFDIADGVAEIGIVVAPERRGRGYGEAMLALAVRRLREELGDRVRPRASVLEHNPASLRLFHGCGFEEVGTGRCADGERIVLLEHRGMVS